MSARDLRTLAVAALVCAALQVVSAYADDRSLETPNTSTQIAQTLIRTGEYGSWAWPVLRGPMAELPAQPLRAYQLPGEPLYLALGFRALPPWAWRLLGVPIIVALVVATGAIAMTVAGRLAGLFAMAVLALDPFVLRHGPVWDDTLLGAALQWTVIAVMAWRCATAPIPSPDASAPARGGRPWIVVIALAAGAAAITRLSCALALGLLGVMVLASTPVRARVRREAIAALIGTAAAVGVWTLRNWMVFGTLFVGSSHDGITIYRATAVSARESLLTTGTTESLDPVAMAPVYRAVQGLGEVELDRFYRREALARLADAPGDVASTSLLKLAVTLTGVDLWQPLVGRRNLGALVVNTILLVTGAIGLARLWRAVRYHPTAGFYSRVAVATTLPMIVLLALGPVGLRYRIDLTVLCAIGTAAVFPAVRKHPVHVTNT